MTPTFSLRPTTADDAAQCFAIYVDGRAHDFDNLPEAVARPLLEMQLRARTMGYAATYPEHSDQMILAAAEPVGRLLTASEPGALRLVDITLLAKVRGAGLGTAVLRSLMLHQPVRLSVNHGNPAAALYRRLGFVRVGGDALSDAMEWVPTVSS